MNMFFQYGRLVIYIILLSFEISLLKTDTRSEIPMNLHILVNLVQHLIVRSLTIKSQSYCH